MKVSLNTVKQYVDINVSVDELVMKINQQLGSVSQVINLGERYKGAVIVKVLSCNDHPNADRLHVCTIDDGGNTPDVKRDESGNIQVVCGAPNVHTDMFAVWLPPKSTVPSSFEDKEPFVLGTRELRGVMSNGMLASPKELGIGDSHEGILEIDPNEWKPSDIEIIPGTSFAKVYALDDIIIDIENKMFTHRPDLFGQLGVAREIFAILQPTPDTDKVSEVRFKEPEWYWAIPEFSDASDLPLDVFNDSTDKIQRFMAVVMQGIEIKPSPLWMQTTLLRWGSKPINNIVDITNYIMLLTAQPTHAYDYEKLRGNKLGARMARTGETVTLLNHKTYKLDESDIVIVDGQGPIGLAGIMGGSGSEVSTETKNVVLEVATFDMYTVRKTSMRHGLFTDALSRFNKGQSYLQTDRIMHELITLTSATQASKVFDIPELAADHDKTSVSGEIRVSIDFINQRLGLGLTTNQIGGLLRFANFASYPSEEDENILLITAPFWRTDIQLAEDIVEEVGRLYGFDKLPAKLPVRSIQPAPINPKLAHKQRIRESLSRAGANEVLTYSFVHENVINKAEQDISQAFKLSNALSPDLQYYRMSVLPSLLTKVHTNVKAGYDEFILFEIGKGHNKVHHFDDDDGLPAELEFVDIVYTSKKIQPGAAYYRAVRLAKRLAEDLGFSINLKPIAEPLDFPVTAPFDQARSALIESTAGVFVGMVGELKQSVLTNFKLPPYTAAITLDLEGLKKSAKPLDYQPLGRYPSVTQDVCFKIDTKVSYSELNKCLHEVLAKCEYEYSLQPLDIYAPEDGDTKNTTFRLELTHPERTLTTQDASDVVALLAKAIEQHLSGSLV